MYIIASPCSIRMKLAIQNVNISKIIRQTTISGFLIYTKKITVYTKANEILINIQDPL